MSRRPDFTKLAFETLTFYKKNLYVQNICGTGNRFISHEKIS